MTELPPLDYSLDEDKSRTDSVTSRDALAGDCQTIRSDLDSWLLLPITKLGNI